MPKVNYPCLFSIIIPYYNDAEGLFACLQGIQRQEGNLPFEVIVVDDCSDLDITREVGKQYPQVIFQRLSRNRGPGAARNRGISLARGTFLAFIDSDAVPNPSWLTCLTAEFNRGAKIVCGPVRHEDSFWARMTALTAFGEYLDDRDGYREHCPSANYAIAARTMSSFSYDETIPFAGEDVLLSTQFIMAGLRIRYLSAAWVQHNPSLSVSKYFRRAFVYGLGFRSSRVRCKNLAGYPLHKYLRAFSALPLFIIRSALDCLRLVKLRKKLPVGWWEFPAFVGGIICTRVIYAMGAAMGYAGRDRH